MKCVNFNDVTSIIFEYKNIKRRFVLYGCRDAMYKLEEKMRNANFEPTLVVDKFSPGIWWCDDYVFAIESLDAGEDMDAYWWGLMVVSTDSWWTAEDGVVFRTKHGEIIRATISTTPCDESHGSCTNDCRPIEL